MAEEKRITPEKQLLKLIEGSTPQGSLRTAAIKHQSLSLFSFNAWLGRFSFLKGNLKGKFNITSLSQLDVKLVNNILFFCVFLLTIYFISNLLVSIINFKKMPDLKFTIQASVNSANLQENQVLKKAAAYYLEKVRARDIFKIGAKKDSSAGKPNNNAPSAKTIEATQDFKLVGISWSNDPDAMIEDTKAMRTFFVKRGQMIRNVKVQAIFKEKVVLSYEGEEVELR